MNIETLIKKLETDCQWWIDAGTKPDDLVFLKDVLEIINKEILSLIDEMIKSGINPISRYTSDVFNKTAFEALTELKQKIETL